MNKFDELIIPYYSPISARGGRRLRKKYTRKHNKSNNSRTRRRYR